jgi:hypothetical protein
LVCSLFEPIFYGEKKTKKLSTEKLSFRLAGGDFCDRISSRKIKRNKNKFSVLFLSDLLLMEKV